MDDDMSPVAIVESHLNNEFQIELRDVIINVHNSNDDILGHREYEEGTARPQAAPNTHDNG